MISHSVPNSEGERARCIDPSMQRNAVSARSFVFLKLLAHDSESVVMTESLFRRLSEVAKQHRARTSERRRKLTGAKAAKRRFTEWIERLCSTSEETEQSCFNNGCALSMLSNLYN